MDLYLLGTAGYHPNNTGQTACLMIPQAGIVLDAGTGFFRVRDLIETNYLHIFLSHCHLDHCVGLSFFLDVIHEKNVDDIFVYAKAEKIKAIREHLFSKHLFPVDPNFHWVEIDSDEVEIPLEGKLKPFPLKHPGGSLGFRLEWPEQSLAYVTDTTADVAADYVKEITGVDLLVHECHFPDGCEDFAETTGHSCLTPVAQVSRAAEVGMTVLIHINPLTEESPPLNLQSVTSIFENMLIGEDNMMVKVER